MRGSGGLLVTRAIALAVAAGFLITVGPAPQAATSVAASDGTFTPAVAPTPSTFPISHIVFLVMENHAFDNYFGEYCQRVGPHCPYVVNGIPPGVCEPKDPTNASRGCVKPYALSQSDVYASPGGPHTWAASHTAYDSAAMDGFYLASGSRTVMGYYTGAELPTYWNIGEHYGLGDNFFSSALSFSLPNHWFILAGQAPNASENPKIPLPGFGQAQPLNPDSEQYLNESNATAAIDDELVNSTVTWKYYDQSLLNATYLGALNKTVKGDRTQPAVFDFKNPLAAKAESYGSALEPHFADYTSFFNDTAAGNLPNVSWLIPPSKFSDHPPQNLSQGMAFVDSAISAVQNTTLWNSTAMFITWDDYGGFFDHVAPLQIDGAGLSFRVPLLVVSPYTPLGYVSHQFGYFESVLHFMEWRFGLNTLTYRDAAASLPLDYFDLNATPRAPDRVLTSSIYPTAEPPAKILKLSGVKAVPSTNGATVSWSEQKGGDPVAGFTVRYGVGSHLSTATVSRPLSTTILSGLSCNTSYTIKVNAFVGSVAGPVTSLKITTGGCAPLGPPFPGLMNSLVALGHRSRMSEPPKRSIARNGTGLGAVQSGGRMRVYSRSVPCSSADQSTGNVAGGRS